MKIAIGADHGGFELKQALLGHFAGSGYELTDFGSFDRGICDYPDIALEVARAVAGGEYPFGVLICGTGVGMSLAANKVGGVRAAAVSEQYSARHARAHNDANILCLGARAIGQGAAVELCELFLATPFDAAAGRHALRVGKIAAIEREYMRPDTAP